MSLDAVRDVAQGLHRGRSGDSRRNEGPGRRKDRPLSTKIVQRTPIALFIYGHYGLAPNAVWRSQFGTLFTSPATADASGVIAGSPARGRMYPLGPSAKSGNAGWTAADSGVVYWNNKIPDTAQPASWVAM